MIRRWTKRHILITLTLCLLSILPVQAQQNLLQNPGFESNYSGRMGRGDFTFPAGWDGWWTDAPRTEAWMNVAPNAFPHSSYFKRSGANAQSISKGGGTFTAAALQQVNDIPAGAIVRGTAWVLIENGDGANAQVRIGIGSNVGTNVYGAITWSGWTKQRNEYQQISIEHTATGGSVTLFIYATQTWPNDPNAVYIDDAELIIVGEGEVPTGGSGGGASVVVPTPPQPSGVAFVVPQSGKDDGEIKHTVGSGDTLASIAVAYGVPVTELLELNGLNRGSFLQIGQVLTIVPADPNTESDDTNDNGVVTTEEASDVVETEDPAIEETEESFGAVITEFTETPEPTETPAESPTPSDTPTETPIPDTATPAPTAPVTEADAQVADPTLLDPGICVSIFTDDNQNGVLEANEPYLADGIIVLSDSENAEVSTYATDGESEPFCFDELDAGRYTLKGTAPEGYGLTTSPLLRVNLEDGETITVQFGAKQGLEVLAMPTVNPNPPTQAPPETGAATEDNDLADYSGLIVFGLAAAVLVIGMGASLLMRRG